MIRSSRVGLAIGVVVLAAYGALSPLFAQARGAAVPPAAPGQGRGAQAAELPPALLFREPFQQAAAAIGVPTSPRKGTGQYWLAGQNAVTNPNVELKLYGADTKNLTVWIHEGRPNFWTGIVGAPIAVMVKHRGNFMDLTGLARVRSTVRTSNLHVLHPVIRLADGTLAAGSQAIETGGQYIQVEVAFATQRWFTLEAGTLVVQGEVMKADLARIDEVGFVDLAPAGGHSSAGWVNIAGIEVYAKPVPR